MNKENKEKVKSNVCLIKDCDRPAHKKSKYCIFHADSKEKTEEEFKGALEKYIEKIKEKGIIYDFMGFIFIGNINFRKDYKVEFFNNIVRFDSAIFHGETSFSGITFNNYAIFIKTKFYGNADFIGVNFQHDAIFNGANFNKVHFNATNFSWNAFFNEASFKCAFFPLVKFNGTTEFGNLYKLERMHFNEARFLSGVSALFGFNIGKATFHNTFLENISLSFELGKDAVIDLKNARLNNTKIKRKDLEGHIIQENEGDFFQAKEVYLLIKNNFHSIGRYDDESWAFVKEKDMERISYSFNSFTRNIEGEDKDNEEKVNKEKKSKSTLFYNWLRTKYFRKWLSLCFSNILFGYGERSRNVIFSAIFIIILFSILFSILGINSLEIIEMKSPTVQEIFNSNSEIISKGNLISKTTNYFIDCLYFSAITFTTLGYGDFRPLEGWGRILAGSEAFIGAFMMALFVYTFARRTGGR